MSDAIGEERAVGEPRQRVVERLVGELRLEAAALGDVARRDDDARDVGILEQVVEDALELAGRAVLPAQRQIARHWRRRRRADLVEERAQADRVAVVQKLGQLAAHELFVRVAEYPPDGWRVVADGEIRFEHRDHVARVLDERAEAFGALALVQALGERGALESERDLRRERLESFTCAPRELLTRVDPELGVELTLDDELHRRALPGTVGLEGDDLTRRGGDRLSLVARQHEATP